MSKEDRSSASLIMPSHTYAKCAQTVQDVVISVAIEDVQLCHCGINQHF